MIKLTRNIQKRIQFSTSSSFMSIYFTSKEKYIKNWVNTLGPRSRNRSETRESKNKHTQLVCNPESFSTLRMLSHLPNLHFILPGLGEQPSWFAWDRGVPQEMKLSVLNTEQAWAKQDGHPPSRTSFLFNTWYLP